MSEQTYRLSKSAISDLRGIIRYTRKNFGDDQVHKYLDQLEQCAYKLGIGQGAIRSLPDIHPDVQYIHCAHHYIYGFKHDGAPFQIIAILNERMDLMARLLKRL